MGTGADWSEVRGHLHRSEIRIGTMRVLEGQVRMIVTRRHVLKTSIAAAAAGPTALVGAAAAAPAHAGQTEGAFRVGTYASWGPLVHSSNTHWIETAEGVIVIDGQWVVSEAEKALREIRSIGKPIIGIFVTHPHTDHVGGLGVFAEAAGRGVPIYASRITLDYLTNDRQGFIGRRHEQFGADFPAQVTLPTEIVADGDDLRLGGVTVRVLDLAENEAATTTMLHLPDQHILFSGDLVGNETTPLVGEGHVERWIEQLATLTATYPDLTIIYPGHGKPGSASALAQSQLDYLTTFRDLVTDGLTAYTFDKRRREIVAAGRAAIVNEMEDRYPNHHTAAGFTERRELLMNNVDWLARELTRDDR